MAYTPGIDVSRYQGEIDWKQVASAGYKFAVIRATIGDYYTDPRFYTNWTGAKDAGLLVSTYHVVVSTKYADKQIGRLFSVLDGRKPDFPVVLDVERDDQVSNAVNTACIQDCIREIGKYDSRKPIIYTAYYYWKGHVLSSPDWAKYDLWVATYGDSPFLPPDWTDWKFWQYSPNGKVPGIGGSTDLDWFKGTYEDLKRYAAGVPQPTPEPSIGLPARVIVPVLNVRSGPGITYKKIDTLKMDDTVNIINISGRDVWLQSAPGKWCACVFGGNQYVEILPAEKAGEGITARVLVDHLNIRSGPAITFADIGNFNTGDTFKISGIRGKDAWVQFDLGKWSACSYGADQYMMLIA